MPLETHAYHALGSALIPHTTLSVNPQNLGYQQANQSQFLLSAGVGKTSIVAKYIANIYSKEIGPTIGASFFTCKINLNNTKVKMQLWDTAGQERFKAMAPLYYRNANAALLVFDVTNHSSFEEVKSWIHELQKNVQEPMFLLLVGNKIDLDEQRAVSREEAFFYSQSIGAKFIETSVVRDQVEKNNFSTA